MTDQAAAAGWYPLPNDPNTERYWNGTTWTEHHRPRFVMVAPPAGGGGSNTGKIVLGIVIGLMLLLGGCIVSTVMLVDSTVDTYELLTSTTLQDDGRPGSVTNPFGFGEPHLRQPGLSGSGWIVIIDDVRDLGDGCVAVVGRATLDVLEDDRTVSLSSSFPEIVLTDERERSTQPTSCNRETLVAEGRLPAQDIEVSEGTTFEWFETFAGSTDDFRYVSVSGTVYEN